MAKTKKGTPPKEPPKIVAFSRAPKKKKPAQKKDSSKKTD